jgi:hypothetical protein
MPFIKQFYDFSDQVPGYRIVYITINEAVSTVMKTLLWVGLYITSVHDASGVTSIKWAFAAASVLSLAIALQPRSYNNQKED